MYMQHHVERVCTTTNIWTNTLWQNKTLPHVHAHTDEYARTRTHSHQIFAMWMHTSHMFVYYLFFCIFFLQVNFKQTNKIFAPKHTSSRSNSHSGTRTPLLTHTLEKSSKNSSIVCVTIFCSCCKKRTSTARIKLMMKKKENNNNNHYNNRTIYY